MAANRFLRSTDGSDSDTGATWALAKATIAGIGAIDAAGDTTYVSKVHAESSASAITASIAGTVTSPSRILGVDDTGDPASPTTLATGATITTTGSVNINFASSAYIYVYGLALISGSGAAGIANINLTGSGAKQRWEACAFRIATTSGSARFNVVNSSTCLTELVDCTMKFAAAGQGVDASFGNIYWRGGSVESGGTSVTSFFLGGAQFGIVDGFDFSNLSSSFNLANASTAASRMVFRNCKLPASWSGSLNSATPGPGARWSMYNCDSSGTNYRLSIKSDAGAITHETTIVRSGGATDGTTALSWKMASNSQASFPTVPLESDEVVEWNDTVGSGITVGLEIVHDSQGAGAGSAFNNDEIWVEAQYLSASGTPLGAIITNAKASVLASAAVQSTSTETWTTTGLTSPVKQSLQVTFTPNMAGFVHLKAVLGKASKTVYVCPKMTGLNSLRQRQIPGGSYINDGNGVRRQPSMDGI